MIHRALQALPFFLSGLAFLDVSASAELVWEQTVYEAKAKEGTKEERAIYRFENKGNYPIVIKRIQTSCGCTTANLGKKEYKPGEQGELNAVFTFGNRKGLQEKSISIETDDEKNPSEILLLRIELPDIIQMKKRELSWEVGDPSEEQVFELAVMDPVAAKITGVRSSMGFESRLQENQLGRAYQIVVKPISTEAPKKGIITIEIEEGNGAKRALQLKAIIQ